MSNLNSRLLKLESEVEIDSASKEKYINAVIKWWTANDKSDLVKIKHPVIPESSTVALYHEVKERMKKQGLVYHPDFLAEMQAGIDESLKGGNQCQAV